MESPVENTKWEFRNLYNKEAVSIGWMKEQLSENNVGESTKSIVELMDKYYTQPIDEESLFINMINDFTVENRKYSMLRYIVDPNVYVSGDSSQRILAKAHKYIAEHPNIYDNVELEERLFSDMYKPLELNFLDDDPNEPYIPYTILKLLILEMTFESIYNFYLTSKYYREALDNIEVLKLLQNKFDLYDVNSFEDLYDQYVTIHPTTLSLEKCLQYHKIEICVQNAIKNDDMAFVDEAFETQIDKRNMLAWIIINSIKYGSLDIAYKYMNISLNMEGLDYQYLNFIIKETLDNGDIEALDFYRSKSIISESEYRPLIISKFKNVIIDRLAKNIENVLPGIIGDTSVVPNPDLSGEENLKLLSDILKASLKEVINNSDEIINKTFSTKS